MAEITIAADPELDWLEELLPEQLVRIVRFDPVEPVSTVASDVDAILVRTVTRVDAETFPGAGRTRFIGTASAGYDHIDTIHLDNLGVGFGRAAGCNASAVGEYVATTLLIWCDHYGIDPDRLSLGIVGCGYTGSAVQRILSPTGIKIIMYDPPKEVRDSSFKSASLNDVLSADILTFHVPLELRGDYPTKHWLTREKLAGCHFSLVINASRGGVIDEQAVLSAQSTGHIQDFILDVWENEPVFNIQAARNAFLTSPHIAGYSLQAKYRAVYMICRQLSDYFGFSLNRTDILHASPAPGVFMAETLGQVLLQIHPIGQYHEFMGSLLKTGDRERGRKFGKLRNAIPLRDEYPYLGLDPDMIQKFPVLSVLGVNKVSQKEE
jgi:erythronate-4-phosphate dehydrogenase